MKLLIGFILSVILAGGSKGHEYGASDGQKRIIRTEPDGPLLQLSVPVSESAKQALELIVEHLDCTVEEFFQMAGLNIPIGGSFIFEPESSNILTLLDRNNAEFVVMLTGDMMIFCSQPEWTEARTRKEILDRYAWTGEDSASWMPDRWRGEKE